MSTTTTEAAPALRQILLDALDDAYEYRKAQVDDCRDCTRQPAGICPDHLSDNDAAAGYEAARKQIEGTLADPDWSDELVRLLPAAACRAHPDDCPNGPEPHLYVPADSDRLVLCCHQPGEGEKL